MRARVSTKEIDSGEFIRVLNIQSTGTALGDGNVFEFFQPIYIWNIQNSATEAYWQPDAQLGTVNTFPSNPVMPFASITPSNANSTWQINNGGSGGTFRLLANQTLTFAKYPLRIRTFGLWRLTAAAIVQIYFSLKP